MKSNRTPKLFITAFKRCFKGSISQLQVQGRVLQLTINTFPDEKEHLQQIHDDLAGALEKCGIEELNLHGSTKAPYTRKFKFTSCA